MSPSRDHFQKLCVGFRAYHQNSLNVAMHLVTTPVSIICVLAMINIYTGSIYATCGLMGLYGLCLGKQLPIMLYAATCASLLVLVYASAVGPIAALSVRHLCGLFVAMYIGQEMAHWICFEVRVRNSPFFRPVCCYCHCVHFCAKIHTGSCKNLTIKQFTAT